MNKKRIVSVFIFGVLTAVLWAGYSRYAQRLKDLKVSPENVEKSSQAEFVASVPPTNDTKQLAAADVEALLVTAQEAISQTNLKKAEGIYIELMKKDPANAYARYGLAVVKGLEGKTLESVEQLHEAFRVSPDLIEKALTDPQLESLRNDRYFQDLLRLENKSIPEMYRSTNSPPVAFDKRSESISDLETNTFKPETDPVEP